MTTPPDLAAIRARAEYVVSQGRLGSPGVGVILAKDDVPALLDYIDALKAEHAAISAALRDQVDHWRAEHGMRCDEVTELERKLAEHAATVERLTIERDNALAFCAEMRQQRNVAIQEREAEVVRLRAALVELFDGPPEVWSDWYARHKSVYDAIDAGPLSPPASPPQAEAYHVPQPRTMLEKMQDEAAKPQGAEAPDDDDVLIFPEPKVLNRMKCLEVSLFDEMKRRADLADEAVRLLRGLLSDIKDTIIVSPWNIRAARAFLARLDAGSKAK